MDIEYLKRKSKQGALISGLGFLFIVLAFILSIRKLSKLNSELSQRKYAIQRNDSIIKSQKALILNLVSEINRLTDSTIQFKARAVAIPGIKDKEGRQIFDFTVWITTTNYTLGRIAKVKYNFRHNTFILSSRESMDGSNGFLVSYRGWGCLSMVEAEIEYSNGRSEPKFFNMCRLLDM